MKNKLIIFVALPLLYLTSCSSHPLKGLDLPADRDTYHNYLKDGRYFHSRDIERQRPLEEVGALTNYPYPGHPYGKGSGVWPTKEAIRTENQEVLSEGKNDLLEGRALKKYRGARGLYTGRDIDESAKAVDMTLNISHGELGFHSTGLYAGPGELVDVYISAVDLNYMRSAPSGLKSFKIAVGQTAQRDFVSNDIPTEKISSSLPLRSIQVSLEDIMKPEPGYPDLYHGVVGSPLGGPLYFFLPQDAGTLPSVSVRFKGALESLYYRQGVTSLSEWNRMAETAPGQYADIMADTVRFSGPATSAIRSNRDIDKAVDFWYKQQRMAIDFDRSGSWYVSRPITQFHDYYVSAGAAVAIVNANRSFLPTDWMGSALNYDNIMAGGVWGEIHELNHHHQHFNQQLWGMHGGGGEITNNLVNAIAYTSYTNCGKARTEAGGSKDWKFVCDPYNNLRKTIYSTAKNSGAYADLSFYVDIYHYFGYDVIKEFAYANRGNTEKSVEANDKAYRKLVGLTGYDFTHYLETVCHWELSYDAKSEISALALPTFYPTASPYQRGRDGRAPTTTAFVVPAAGSTVLNFSETLLTTSPTAVVRQIKRQDGKALKNNGDGTFTFNPQKAGPVYRFAVEVELEKEQFVTLDCELEKDPSSLEVEIFDVSDEKMEHIDTLDLDQALKKKSPIRTLKTKKTSIANYKISDSDVKKTLARVSFDLLPSEDADYELSIFGSRETALIINGDKILTNSSATSSFASAGSAVRHYRAGERLKVTLYALGTESGRAEFGWRTLIPKGDETDDFGSIQTPSYENFASPGNSPSNLYREGDFANQFPEKIQLNGSIVSRPGQLKVVKTSPADQTCEVSDSVSKPKGNCSGGDGTMNVIVDGDTGSYWHSQYLNGSPGYPYTIFIENSESMIFNGLKMTKRSHANPFMNKFDIYVGPEADLAKMRKIYSDENNKNQGVINVDLGSDLNDRFIALHAREGGGGPGQNYLAIAEFQLVQNYSSDHVYGFDAEGISFDGSWSYQPNGNSLSGYSMLGSSGSSLKFSFYGQGLGLTATSSPLLGAGTVTIDGVRYRFDTYSSDRKDRQLVFAANLKRGRHQVEISVDRGSQLELNAFSLVAPENKATSKQFSAAVITLAVTLATLIAAALLLNRFGLLECKINRKKGGHR